MKSTLEDMCQEIVEDAQNLVGWVSRQWRSTSMAILPTTMVSTRRRRIKRGAAEVKHNREGKREGEVKGRGHGDGR